VAHFKFAVYNVAYSGWCQSWLWNE